VQTDKLVVEEVTTAEETALEGKAKMVYLGRSGSTTSSQASRIAQESGGPARGTGEMPRPSSPSNIDPTEQRQRDRRPSRAWVRPSPAPRAPSTRAPLPPARSLGRRSG